ncbi:MAG TPA: tRNA uridine-5-carboxymethylaminomethyl(34) synthesis GTPase MnmE [candidate division Zixibacteria bacterium]|nr:tRNA uridine-5-carboxymethylaminomethyl(34) synthesis GTPase MnmE [candidate division Zixibacteria bacterium]
MYRDGDIIAAIITPPGEGGLGAIRCAGPGARKLCAPFLSWATIPEPFHLIHTTFSIPSASAPLDEVMAVWMPSGKSYTGEEQVEIFTHGGRVVLQQVLRALFDAGARPAEPGEFTRRAFLSGRIDLTRAEAVAELISAKSEFAYRAARDNLFGETASVVTHLRERLIELAAELEANVDFPEEEIQPEDHERLVGSCARLAQEIASLAASYRRGVVVRDGFKVALAGRPNAGKSSLFNALLGRHRALVSETPGTTRDYLSEWITLGGFAVELIDTAGLRDSSERLERAGQELARALIDAAHLTLWIVDSAEPDWVVDYRADLRSYAEREMLVVVNKIDLLASAPTPTDDRELCVSCATGAGLGALEARLVAQIEALAPDQTDGMIVTSERHQRKLLAAHEALERARAGLEEGLSPELIAFEISGACAALDEITGAVYTDDLLERIFSKFCIGK